ncbi:MAG: sugar transferase, partial [Fervidobacterium sp.]
MVLGAYAFRAYEQDNLESLNEQLIRLLIPSLFASFLVSIFIPSEEHSTMKNNFFTGLMCNYFVLPVVNTVFYYFIKTKIVKPKEYLVIGRKEEIEHILSEITEKSRGKYLFVDFVNPSPTTVKQKIRKYDNILVANFELYKRAEYLIEPYKSSKKIEYLSDLSERVLKRIPLEVIDKFREYYELQFESVKESPAKRIVDVFGAVLGLVLFSPVILISAIIIFIEDGRPVI